jgi:hypothetical protein
MAVKPWDIFSRNKYTDSATAASRLEICGGCEFLFKKTNTCKKCGCFMDLKTKLTNASCPIGKW